MDEVLKSHLIFSLGETCLRYLPKASLMYSLSAEPLHIRTACDHLIHKISSGITHVHGSLSYVLMCSL